LDDRCGRTLAVLAAEVRSSAENQLQALEPLKPSLWIKLTHYPKKCDPTQVVHG
jgi:hypothetical protein